MKIASDLASEEWDGEHAQTYLSLSSYLAKRDPFPSPLSPFTISLLSLFIIPFPHTCCKNWRRWPLVLAVEGLAHFLSSVNTGRVLPSKLQNSYYSIISHPADTRVDPGVPQVAKLQPATETISCGDQDFHARFLVCSYDGVFHKSAVVSLRGAWLVQKNLVLR